MTRRRHLFLISIGCLAVSLVVLACVLPIDEIDGVGYLILSGFVVAQTALLVSGILLLRGKLLGNKLTLVASGALVFLGLLDISFNIQNGIYASSMVDLILNVFINLWCVGFGIAIAWIYIRVAGKT